MQAVYSYLQIFLGAYYIGVVVPVCLVEVAL
jgi:hypothetical protein